jgi:tRNA pseudouridine38-40 synthase
VTRTIRLQLAYDGASFRGWASQRDPSIRTVEGVLIDALSPVVGEPVKLSVAGRTDAGVHARGQVASFTTVARVPAPRIRGAINARLGPEVACWDAIDAPRGFDARFSASAREYRYRINTAAVSDPFVARYAWHHPMALDLSAMRAAARCLIGERDFRSFCRHPGEGKTTVRNLQKITVARRGDVVELGFRANAFLHHMVRTMMVTLVRVGEGKLQPGDVATLLVARDRTAVRGNLAPAHGLTLERVFYGRRVDPTLTASRSRG